MATADLEALTTTRRALHVVAEHVLMPDLYGTTGHIGLRLAPGGFATPPYERPPGATRRLRVEGTEVVDERDGRIAARVPLTTPITLHDLRLALGVTALAPADIYDLGSDGNLRQVLVVDPESAAQVAALFAATGEALDTLRGEARTQPEWPEADEVVTSVRLWPENFDLTCSVDEVAYGASPGDDAHPEPYLYVAPWVTPQGDEGPWNEAFGARRPAWPVPSADEILAWFRQIRAAIPE